MLWIKLKYIVFFLLFVLSSVYLKFVINYAYTYSNDNSDYFLYVILNIMLIILPLFYTFFLYKEYKLEKVKYEKRNSKNIITRVSSYSIKKKLNYFECLALSVYVNFIIILDREEMYKCIKNTLNDENEFNLLNEICSSATNHFSVKYGQELFNYDISNEEVKKNIKEYINNFLEHFEKYEKNCNN